MTSHLPILGIAIFVCVKCEDDVPFGVAFNAIPVHIPIRCPNNHDTRSFHRQICDHPEHRKFRQYGQGTAWCCMDFTSPLTEEEKL